MTRARRLRTASALGFAVLLLAACTEGTGGEAAPAQPGEPPMTQDDAPEAPRPASGEIATLGAGCFWCVEAVLEQVEGVLDVASGYMGGHVEEPTYEEVCGGRTGHAEVVQVTFDPSRLAYEDLLGWFFRLHDPTTKDRQGRDVGPQYRSVIFWHTDAQREAAERARSAADLSGAFDAPVVTEIAEAGPFWPAETYHQDYYRRNRSQPYCRAVIAPKLEHLDLER